MPTCSIRPKWWRGCGGRSSEEPIWNDLWTFGDLAEKQGYGMARLRRFAKFNGICAARLVLSVGLLESGRVIVRQHANGRDVLGRVLVGEELARPERRDRCRRRKRDEQRPDQILRDRHRPRDRQRNRLGGPDLHHFRPYRSSRRTTSSSSGVLASRTSQSLSATMRCTIPGRMRTDSPARSSTSRRPSPRSYSNRIDPESRWMVSSLCRWYWRLRACPAAMWRIFPTYRSACAQMSS